jgi:hypothetical protein
MMNNHYHLLLETPEANLVAWMKWLQGSYTQRYNSRHEIFGHLGGTEFKERMLAMVEQPELERLKRRLEQVYENHNGEVDV